MNGLSYLHTVKRITAIYSRIMLSWNYAYFKFMKHYYKNMHMWLLSHAVTHNFLKCSPYTQYGYHGDWTHSSTFTCIMSSLITQWWFYDNNACIHSTSCHRLTLCNNNYMYIKLNGVSNYFGYLIELLLL